MPLWERPPTTPSPEQLQGFLKGPSRMRQVLSLLGPLPKRVVASLLILLTFTTCATTTSTTSNTTGIHKIQHVMIIMQENRSFDSYFGTYPGADGIPAQNGVATVCVNDPKTGQCVKPYYDARDINGGGPHDETAAAADINGDKMDGFIAQAE